LKDRKIAELEEKMKTLQKGEGKKNSSTLGSCGRVTGLLVLHQNRLGDLPSEPSLP